LINLPTLLLGSADQLAVAVAVAVAILTPRRSFIYIYHLAPALESFSACRRSMKRDGQTG
jgi:hypothetical protein